MSLRSFKLFKIIFFFTFLGGLFISYIPNMNVILWMITALSFFLGFLVIIEKNIRGDRFTKDKSFLIWGGFIFLLYVIMCALLNNVDGYSFIIGVKNNFQFFPILVFFLVYPTLDKASSTLMRWFLVVAMLQPPIAILQYIFVVPLVSAERTGELDSSVLDSVNGTFGISLHGGGTGVLMVFLCIVITGLLASYLKNKISLKVLLVLSLYLMMPMLINETKALFLFLAVAGVSVLLMVRGTGGLRKVTITIVGSLLVVGAIMATLVTIESYGQDIDDIIEESVAYNIGDKGYGDHILNRLTCLTFWWERNVDNPLRILIGYGLDSANEGISGLGVAGSVGSQYLGFGIGLTTVSRMLWETGIIGTLVLIGLFAWAGIKSVKCARSLFLSTDEAIIASTVSVGCLLIIMGFFYNDMYRNSQPGNFLSMLLISLTVWLARVQSFRNREAECTSGL